MVCLSSAMLLLLYTTYRYLIPAPALCWQKLKEHMDLSGYWRYPATVYRCPSSSLKKLKMGGGRGKLALTGGNLESSDYPICIFFLVIIRLKLQLKDYFLRLSVGNPMPKTISKGRVGKRMGWAQIKMNT